MNAVDAEIARQGAWMQTASGGKFWPLAPRVEDVRIEDIAHALSLMCRYGGHCIRFYSVAEHSVLMARKASRKNKLTALLHDAPEAFIADIVRPVKPHIKNYKRIEAKLARAIGLRFGIPAEMPAEVHALDTAILMDEKAQNVAPGVDWGWAVEPLGVKLQYWTPARAEREFLKAFERYAGIR